MPPSRRAVLTGAGAAAVVGLGGYHQRRRLRRFPAWADLRSIPRIPVPDVDDAVVVTDAHLERATSLLETRLASFEERDADGDELVHTHENWIDRAREDRDEAIGLDSDASNAERRRALRGIHNSTREVATVVARIDHDRGELTEAEADERAADVLERVEAADLAYTGEPVTEATIQLAEAEAALGDATRVAEDLADERDPQDRLELAERVETSLLDVEEFSASVDGPDVEDRLEDRYRTLADRADELVDDVDFSHDGTDHPSAASDFELSRLSRRQPDDDDPPAIALRDAAYVYAVSHSLEDLSTFPATIRGPDYSVEDRGFEVSDVEAAKRDAAEAIDEAADAHGGDPLARRLLGAAVSAVEGGDRTIENVRRNVNRAEDGFWAAQQQEALVDYRVAAEIARRVPDVLGVVED